MTSRWYPPYPRASSFAFQIFSFCALVLPAHICALGLGNFPDAPTRIFSNTFSARLHPKMSCWNLSFFHFQGPQRVNSFKNFFLPKMSFEALLRVKNSFHYGKNNIFTWGLVNTFSARLYLTNIPINRYYVYFQEKKGQMGQKNVVATSRRSVRSFWASF